MEGVFCQKSVLETQVHVPFGAYSAIENLLMED